MIRALIFLSSGIVFGIGLALSRMTSPAKVVGFLDFTGRWDPSLAATMAGAVAVAALGHWLVRRRGQPLLAAELPSPPPARIDARLLAGAVIFGAGWGLAGMCPAPAIAVAVLHPASLWFVAGFVVGAKALTMLDRPKTPAGGECGTSCGCSGRS